MHPSVLLLDSDSPPSPERRCKSPKSRFELKIRNSTNLCSIHLSLEVANSFAMDAKALAKSKRAHSLHHSKKSHSHQKPKPQHPPTTNDAASKDSSKKVKEKPSHPVLPSNWDRYGEESGSDDEKGIGKVPNDVVLPKSKGADFRYLVAEAQSHCQSNDNVFAAVEDAFSGTFSYRLGPLLSVRGEGILSWTGDDNFVVEDEAGGSHEASFLSLNLHALAEQLEKVDISERLFIEPDLLPPELGLKTSSSMRESDEIVTSDIKPTTAMSEESVLGDFSKNSEGKTANHTTEVISSKSTDDDYSDVFSFNQGSEVLNEVDSEASSDPYGKFGQRGALESSTQISASSVAEPDKRDATFEAAAAEAELDMLLNSFDEAKLHDSPISTHQIAPGSTKEAPKRTAQSYPSASEVMSPAANLDDLLDNLLEESSNSLNQSSLKQPWRLNTTRSHESPLPTSQSASESKDLNDFDSWLDTI